MQNFCCVLAEPEPMPAEGSRSSEEHKETNKPQTKAETKNCWEFLVCKVEVRAKCPAYALDMGRECWLIASTYQAENCPSRKKRGVLDCVNCSWYLKLNPDVKE